MSTFFSSEFSAASCTNAAVIGIENKGNEYIDPKTVLQVMIYRTSCILKAKILIKKNIPINDPVTPKSITVEYDLRIWFLFRSFLHKKYHPNLPKIEIKI
ncbi:unnamed protein product [marine sediment metagenome]|uniref:Uncharacterized protein n=1 Tax=marine sediment metagenome TaxID=412755 RepID=X1HCS8_9ZZZZ